jgi:hypothetical protein
MRTVNRRGIESMAVMLYHSAVRDRRRSLRIILNVYTHRVSGWFRIGIDIRFTVTAQKNTSPRLSSSGKDNVVSCTRGGRISPNGDDTLKFL